MEVSQLLDHHPLLGHYRVQMALDSLGSRDGHQQHALFVQDDQFWGHWAHQRTDAQGWIYHLSPEVILDHARVRTVKPVRLRRVFRLPQQTRQGCQQGQIRLHNFVLSSDQGLWGQTVEVLLYDEPVRVEQDEHLLVS